MAVAAGALAIGSAVWAAGFADAAKWIWGIGTVPVATGLLLSMVRDLRAGRMGVDAIAFISMAAAMLLGETLAGGCRGHHVRRWQCARGFCRWPCRARIEIAGRSGPSGGGTVSPMAVWKMFRSTVSRLAMPSWFVPVK